MKKKKKQNNMKVVLFIFICVIVIFLVCCNSKTKVKKELSLKGYSDKQITQMLDYKFDTKLILEYDKCSTIDDILKKDFDQKELKKYLETCDKEVTKPVDKPQDDPFVTALKNEKYYIPNRLDRYLAYKEKNANKQTKDIVTEVNCNIDRPYYTNVQNTDRSMGHLMIVNKYYQLGKGYEPDNKKLISTTYSNWNNSYLEGTTYDAFMKMVKDAESEGYYLVNTSAFRTYEDQESLFNGYLKTNGEEWTLKSSAKPGHSEHHTGFATDIVKRGVSMYSFGETKEFTWVKNNAHKYGFILRYPDGKEYLTGYMYEPWHYRYVGKEVAEYIYENDIVFEEYYAYFCEYKGTCK